MINEEIIFNYVKNHGNLSEEELVDIIYYDSPVSINKNQIIKILHHLVDERRVCVKQNDGVTRYSVNNSLLT